MDDTIFLIILSTVTPSLHVVAFHRKEEAIFFEAFPEMHLGKTISMIVQEFVYLILTYLNDTRVSTKSKVANELFHIIRCRRPRREALRLWPIAKYCQDY